MDWTIENENPHAQIYRPKVFQRAWLEALEHPYIETSVLQKSARVGYAIFMNSSVGWIICNDPGNIMIAQNTENDADKFSANEVGKVLNHCSAVRQQLFGKNTAKEKSFLGGELGIVWATSANSFRMATIRYLFLDEVSGYPDNVDGEGDPIDLAMVRTETEAQRKIVMGSTPKEKGTCKISREFKLGDQRYFYVPCPHCQHKQRLKLDNFRYDANDFKSAHFVCEACGEGIYEHHKHGILNQGEWRATREFTCCDTHQVPETWDHTGTALCAICGKPGDKNERDKVNASWHIWSAYNDNPNTSLASIAAEYEKAKKDSAKMQTFMNTRCGVPYSDAGEHYKLKGFEQLYTRRELFNPEKQLPKATRCILGSVDTQKYRFEYHLWAVGENGETWALDYGAVHGDPEEEETQTHLIEKLTQPFSLVDGRQLVAYAVVMDCNGHAWKAMLEFVAPYQGWLYAIRGDAYGKNKFKTDLTLSYSVHKEVGCEYRTINVHQLKNKAAERLNLTKFGKNYVHYPNTESFNLDYFQMLTAEHLIGSGSNVKWDIKPGHKRNEPWDLLVYFLWLYEYLRPTIRLASPDRPLGLRHLHAEQAQSDELESYHDGYELSDYENY
ncbi:terminase gpA endonuclease subunit [Vibrio barjaei]|uniref:Terminase gpA endonuclease subunit n=1 Tax=Vibrio barjaei TaxID=1676683 RepID=A0ABW7ID39_9VIBR